ncbi:FtsH protease activity modulator HflK [Teredinibacter franksiae]|uniref:FtsH protease activity modulator HflK n=1 Tax=Teredinibacter franksiae TaxID=2761453 RepID=UPI001626B090|nr:FtsH protease activity modulator HflK [Teredinibacter franksiae]
MAWNEPGGNKDPWGGGNRGNDGPPDLDEALKNIQKKFSGLFGGGKNGGGKNAGFGFSWSIVALLIVIGLVIYAIVGAGIVNEQERAVILRLGTYNTTKDPGFRWNPPLVDKVYTINVTNVRQWSTSEQMLTKDLNIVDIKLSVQYIIEDARDFLLNVKDPENSLQQATNSALRHVAGSALMHDVLTEGREQVAFDIQALLQRYLNNYKTGIRVETVNIEDSNPPREVQGAFDEVIEAREDEERYKNQAEAYSNGIIPEARGGAQRVIEEATAYKEKVIAEAEGEAKRFEYLLTEYKKAPEVTRQRLYIDAVEDVMSNSSKVMVDVEGGNNMLYLPLDKIISSSQQSSSRSFTASELDALAERIKNQAELDDSGLTSRRREGR